MLYQIAIGSLLIIVTGIVSTVIWWALAFNLSRMSVWSQRPPHGPKLAVTLGIALFWSVVMVTVASWIWALAFRYLGMFGTYEEALYFSLVAFTTLGFGDLLLPKEWRLLGGLAAANGLLIFGLLTAMLVETLRETRLRQRDHFRT